MTILAIYFLLATNGTSYRPPPNPCSNPVKCQERYVAPVQHSGRDSGRK